MPSQAISILLDAIDTAYDRKSWHGTNLRGSLRGVSHIEAAYRPSKQRHNIWELALHAAYWKYTVRRRLLGEPRNSFALKGSNWFVRPTEGKSTDADWRADLAILEQSHRALRGAIADLTPAQLDVVPDGSKTTIGKLVIGVAAHDLYHAGQIQLLKRLRGE